MPKPQTIRIESSVRPDLGYTIINLADFNPQIHTLWSEPQPQPELTPVTTENPTPEQPPKRSREKGTPSSEEK